jgi:hypothetical protein
MRPSLAMFVACSFLMGCGASPIRSTKPNTSAPTKDVAAREVAVPTTSSEPIIHRMPQPDAACPLFFPPREVGSVVRIPAKMMSLAMDPVMRALCACTKPGEYTSMQAQIDFGKGIVQVRAHESSLIDECLAASKVTFEPPPASDVPSSDCIGCGPRYYGVFPDSPPPPQEPGLRLMYSFYLDRSSEVLDCPATTHAERGACQNDKVAAPPLPDKRTCGCNPGDLKCALTCAAGK